MPPPVPGPPPAVVLAYRFFGWRVGPAYKDWVLDDILRRGWVVRQGAPAVSAVLLLGAAIFGVLDGDGSKLLALVFVLAAGGLFLRNSLRERALRQQGIDAMGTPLELAPWYADDRARLRRNVLSAVATVVLIVAGLIVLALRSQP